MLKLALILFFVSISFGKLAKTQLKLFEENENVTSEKNKEIERKKYLEPNNTIWVLNLLDDSLDFQRIYLANKAEKRVFKNIIMPAIQNYKLQRSLTMEKNNPEMERFLDDPESSEVVFKINNISEIKSKILVLMNKFFLNQLSEPNSYLSEVIPKNEQKSLKLYFIGPYTSLIMTSTKMRYHYFINPPSPLPSWFYGEHKNILSSDSEKYVDIPIEIQHQFLEELLNILNTYIGFPV